MHRFPVLASLDGEDVGLRLAKMAKGAKAWCLALAKEARSPARDVPSV